MIRPETVNDRLDFVQICKTFVIARDCIT